jgi:Uma2 family endonuclease
MLAVGSDEARALMSAEPAPVLESGDTMRSREFLRRYERMPHVKKAELIEGVVYIGSPVRRVHAKPDGLIQTWLGTYAAHTPGTEALPNATVILDPDNTLQPDALLRLLPERGGRTRENAEGYLLGLPELVVEIAATSASIDLRDKLRAYRRSGVLEYLVWRTAEHRFDWFCLEEDEYQAQTPDAHGLLRSRTFPGLVLALQPLLDLDTAAVLAALETGLASNAHAAFGAPPNAEGKP